RARGRVGTFETADSTLRQYAHRRAAPERQRRARGAGAAACGFRKGTGPLRRATGALSRVAREIPEHRRPAIAVAATRRFIRSGCCEKSAHGWAFWSSRQRQPTGVWMLPDAAIMDDRKHGSGCARTARAAIRTHA